MSTAITESQTEETTSTSRSSGPWLYLLIRFLLIIPTVFILTTAVFFMMRITGDPVTAQMGGQLPRAELERRTGGREPATQTRPWLTALPAAAASAAACRSGASAKTMFGLLPPASSHTRFMFDSPA